MYNTPTKVHSVYTIKPVLVDCCISERWHADRNGTKDIIARNDGVVITWNFGHTFVPWPNVACVAGHEGVLRGAEPFYED